MASSGSIQTIFSDREKQNPLYPRSKVKAISDDSGKSLELILDELRQEIESGGDFELPDTVMLKSGGKFTGAVEYTTLKGGNITSSGTVSADEGLTTKGAINATGNITGAKVYGAVWNDYAEYRESTERIEAGYIVCENGDDTVSLSSERLQPAPLAVSDTFGFAIGETDKCKCPVAVAGRVLVFPYEDRNSYKPGDAVCAAPGGKVSKMSREEIREYPERILGTVSAIPSYKFWGDGNIEVKNRIWIKI